MTEPSAAETREPARTGSAVATGDGAWPLRRYQKRPLDTLARPFIKALARFGIGPFQMMTVRGRKTGTPYTTPVTLVEQDGRRWLVAPYGPVSWVQNARAAGQVTIEQAGNRQEYAIREVSPEEAGPVLKQYVAVASVTRPYFAARPDAPVAEFVAEAARHPVFELTPIPNSPANAQR